MSAAIRIDTITNPPHAVVLVRGEIDSSTAPQLAAALEALAADTTTVELDFTDVSFLDSTGLSVVASLVNRLHPLGGRVAIRRPSDLIVRLLTVTDLLRFVDIVGDDDSPN